MAKSRTEIEIRAKDNVSRGLRRIRANLGLLNRKLRTSQARWDKVNKVMRGFTKTLRNVSTKMRDVGARMFRNFALPLAGGIGFALNEFRKFEKGLIGVDKTTDFSRETLDRIGKTFIDMSMKIPLPADELLKLGEAAGQMGVDTEAGIVSFGETLGKLSFTTDVVGEEGARAIARILDLTRELDPAGENVKGFANTLVFLGNTTAATENEILGVANRIGGNIARFGASSNDILVLAAAFKGLGKESELVGSITGKVFNSMEQAILAGSGKAFKAIQTLTSKNGVFFSKEEMKKQLANNPLEFFLRTLKGLQDVQKEQGKAGSTANLKLVLDDLNLTGVRVNDILGTAIVRLDKFQEKQKQIREGDQIGAMQEEFSKFQKSFDADITLTINALRKLGIAVGTKLAPFARGFLEIVRDIADFFVRHPGWAEFLLWVGAIGTAMGAALVVVGTLGLALSGLAPLVMGTGLTALMAEVGVFGALGGVAIATLPLLILFGSLIFLILGAIKHWRTLKQLKDDFVNDPAKAAEDYTRAVFGSEEANRRAIMADLEAKKSLNLRSAEQKVFDIKSRQQFGEALAFPSFAKFSGATAGGAAPAQKVQLEVNFNAPPGFDLQVMDQNIKENTQIELKRGRLRGG